MNIWFWYFICYSFLGCCLEKLFARLTRSPRRVRKCFLLLPLCPVYGIAMVAVIALLDPSDSLLRLALLGGAICTGAEYLVHLFYDRVFHVRFWDYTGLPMQLGGRVCLAFSMAWGVLSALALRFVQPVLVRLTAILPPTVTFLLWLVLAADLVLSGSLLFHSRDTELLSLRALRAQTRASSQSSTSR